MINHVVLMKFKPGVKESDIENIEKRMNDLPNTITEIQMYEFGRNLIPSERSYDFALVSLFANPEAVSRYQAHPDHLLVVEKLKNICDSIVVVDFEGSDASSLKEKIPASDLTEW